MANSKLGIKRTCPETDRNFYDLNKDPIVSPYTNKEYPLTFFETGGIQKKSGLRDHKSPVAAEKDFDVDATIDARPKIIPLSEVEEEEKNINNNEEVISDVSDVDIDDGDVKPEDSAFLEEDAEDSDLSNVIGTQSDSNKDET